MEKLYDCVATMMDTRDTVDISLLSDSVELGDFDNSWGAYRDEDASA